MTRKTRTDKGASRPAPHRPEFGRCSCGDIVIYRGTGILPKQCDACRVEANRARARAYMERVRALKKAARKHETGTKIAEPLKLQHQAES